MKRSDRNREAFWSIENLKLKIFNCQFKMLLPPRNSGSLPQYQAQNVVILLLDQKPKNNLSLL